MIVVCKLFGCDARSLMIGSSLEPISWSRMSMFALVDWEIIIGPAASLLGLLLVVRLLIAPLFVLFCLFGMVALSDIKGTFSCGLLYCDRNLIERVKSN